MVWWLGFLGESFFFCFFGRGVDSDCRLWEELEREWGILILDCEKKRGVERKGWEKKSTEKRVVFLAMRFVQRGGSRQSRGRKLRRGKFREQRRERFERVFGEKPKLFSGRMSWSKEEENSAGRQTNCYRRGKLGQGTLVWDKDKRKQEKLWQKRVGADLGSAGKLDKNLAREDAS